MSHSGARPPTVVFPGEHIELMSGLSRETVELTLRSEGTTSKFAMKQRGVHCRPHPFGYERKAWERCSLWQHRTPSSIRKTEPLGPESDQRKSRSEDFSTDTEN